MTPGRSPLFTRRRVLTGLGVGLVATGVSETGAFESVEAPRTSTIQVAGNDQEAILALKDFKENPDSVYKEPQKVTVTNQTESELTDNRVRSDINGGNGYLEFRNVGGSDSKTNKALGDLSTSRSDSFEIVTAPDESGEVTDTVTLEYAAPGDISITVVRDITVSFKSSGRLVYAINGDVRVYDAVQDEELSPPNSTDADIIGGSAADFTAGDDADIAFASTSKDGMYSTEVGANSENTIRSTSPSDHYIKKENTRFALAKWPAISDDDPVVPGEYVVVYADSNQDKLFAMDADGNTEEILDSGDGAAGAAGVADIDGGEKEMVFLDGSQQLRYLKQDGTTSKIEDGGVGSDDDAGAGYGPPASFENFSNVQVPFIDTSSQPSLVDHNGNKTTLASDTDVNAKKAACAPVDVDDDDGELEFVFINFDGNIAYIDDVGGSNEQVKELVIGEGVDGNTDVTRSPDPSAGLNSGTRPDS